MFRARSMLALVNALALTAMITACGGDDDDDDGGGSSAAAIASCKQVCAEQAAGNCSLFPVDACNQLCDAFAQASPACQSAMKSVSDCQLEQGVCDVAVCDDEEMAFQQACSGG
ncbi:MAG TPA: hypothetical protein VM686_26530 [Polyangiaceae bacterium]|nr:hypothetical protein [Polyangiaceae bacterium]